MRVGRIILALLAPLVSLPALAESAQDQLPPQAQTPAVDSLLRLLRSVVPVVAAAADSENSTVHADRGVWPVITGSLVPATLTPAAEAALRLRIRQQHRSLLRC